MVAKKQNRRRRHHARRAEHPLIWKLKSWFVPHSQNAYRPHLINRYSLSVIAVLCISVFMFSSQSKVDVLGQQDPITPLGLLDETNHEREKAGVSSLTINTQLTKAASMKAKDMINHNYWAHTSPDGVTPWHWVQQAGYSYAYAGENLARNFTSDSAVVSAWMASDSHRDNMLHKYYTEVGFAVIDGKIDDKPTRIIVAVYATPTDALTEIAGAQTTTPNTPAQIGFMSRIGIALQSMNPSMLGMFLILTLVLIVALLTVVVSYGQKVQPATFWRRHHGIFKVGGISLIMVTIIIIQGTGQII